ncbi:M48 family metalloprotease [Aestuariibaculum sediminum]|uniref:M48 family metalloprotease n=1 Tax=Aestuariibaculum sediminum TaxID=2770637 RepID=A0A8J6UEB3_9FLAO|nr:M48 family metallopeptidase [Aestuariibaculum sediminum]MBD0830611.1 M48 family metalloprotease [Aestuariibaculum sediminum]
MIKDTVKLSEAFKAQTKKAIISICLFVFTYVIMLALSVGLTLLCVYGGIALITAKPTLITIALGIGLASMGVFILIFLIKFIFKSHKTDRSHLVEITKENEPELFNLIGTIVKQVGTNFPKKVYLSSEVNAAVFYDSNFWSMIFPVQKNLLIGVGLVNTITKAELTAILSHEFGHFSQKSMKVGSYVYNVNQVIFNMLYDNDSYDKMIQGWANVSGYFSIFAIIAVKIIEGIKSVLKNMYELVNKNYMSLSREMEFHADEIAASITGYEPLKSSLLRMELTNHALNAVFMHYENKIAENVISENIFKEQTFVMNFIAEDNQIPIKANLPMLSVEEINKFNKSKLVITDQWASHPSTEERIERLEKIIDTSTNHQLYTPANDIFKDYKAIQTRLTKLLFKDIKYETEPTVSSFETFKDNFTQEFYNNTFPKYYNGYYDNKIPVQFELPDPSEHLKTEHREYLFSEEKLDLIYTSIALQNDIDILNQIADKSINLKTFDYDGIKYSRKHAKTLINKLSSELETTNTEIKENDLNIFKYFLGLESPLSQTSTLKTLYLNFFKFNEGLETKYEIYNNLNNALQFVSQVTPVDKIRANFINIQALEIKLKDQIKAILKDPKLISEMTKEMTDNFEAYLSKQWIYFGNENYFDKNLQMLYIAMNNFIYLLSREQFLLKKELLQYQIELLPTAQKSVSNN